ncbi:MAG: TatD family hydrolase [Victivallaceae bacterium]|nr:TatD family hydrolase [Victivallaceae bacterium]
MKSSIPEPAAVTFADFHTHRLPLPPQTLGVVSLELSDPENFPPYDPNCTFFSVGLHPWRLPAAAGRLESDLAALRLRLIHLRAVAVGETGLDRLRGPDMKIQQTYFIAVLKLARELDKPVIAHCVRGYPELLALKRQFAPGLKLLVHGYNGSPFILEQLWEHDCLVSFGPAGLRRSGPGDYIRQKPEYLSRIGLETDASGIDIAAVFETAAQLFGVELQELARIMRANFAALFHRG